jgi:hypothetical protein
MKHICAVLAFFLSLHHVHAQLPDNIGWCPAGARWTYSYFVQSGALQLRQFAYKKDTLIASKTAKKIDEKAVYYAGPFPQGMTESFIGSHYFFESNDSIFRLENDLYRFCYSLNGQVNDQWITGSTYLNCPGGLPSSDTITVLSLHDDTLSNKIYTRRKTNSHLRAYHLGDILGKIGPLESLFPVMNSIQCPTGTPNYQSLVCYYDDARGFVDMNSNLSLANCGTLASTGVRGRIVTEVFIYPNPAMRMIAVGGLKHSGYTYHISDMNGRVLKTGQITGTQIPVDDLRPGIYFIEFSKARERFVSKIVKL